jgi:hypothetical protein
VRLVDVIVGTSFKLRFITHVSESAGATKYHLGAMANWLSGLVEVRPKYLVNSQQFNVSIILKYLLIQSVLVTSNSLVQIHFPENP